MQTMSRATLYSWLLLFASAIWGAAFVVMKDTLAVVPTNYILALRFLVGGLGLVAFLWRARRDAGLWWRGALLGVLMYAAFAVQTYGLYYTTASKNALITSVYVVLVPFFVWLVQRRAVSRRVVLSAFLAFVGIAILSPERDFHVGLGDLLTLFSGLLYALHITMVGLYSEKHEVMALTCLQFLVASSLAWVGALGFEAFPSQVGWGTWTALAYLSFGSTLLGLTLMNLGIKYVTPSRASILLGTEAVFGCFFGSLFQGDPLTGPIVLGGAVLTLAVVLSQTEEAEAPGSPSPVEAGTPARLHLEERGAVGAA